jgi:hypothetical protein
MASLINIIQAVNAPQYPIRHSQLVFFCELTNGHGRTKTKIRIVDTQREDRVIFEQQGTVEFTDVRQVVTLAVNMQGIVFEGPGEYRFQIFAEEQLLGERGVLCRKVEPPAKSGGPE